MAIRFADDSMNVICRYIEDIWCIMPFGMTREDIIAGIAASNDRYGGKSPNVRCPNALSSFGFLLNPL